MIDTHCHILWGIDDASKTIAESLDMARVAASDGIKVIVATSHIKEPIYYNSAKKLHELLITLQKRLEQEKIDVKLILGGENYVSHHTIHKLEEGTFLTYNGGSYMLVEFAWTINMKDNPTHYLQKIIEKGYVPVVAHPERYQWVHEDYSLLEKWRQMGCLMQVNRTSILSLDKIEKANTTALRMLEDDLIDMIASDAHRSYAPRLPKLSDVYRFVEKRYGKERSERYFCINPQILINNKKNVD